MPRIDYDQIYARKEFHAKARLRAIARVMEADDPEHKDVSEGLALHRLIEAEIERRGLTNIPGPKLKPRKRSAS